MTPPSILLLAGEASGDYHAAALVRDLKQLRPEIRVSGIGGDKLAKAGMNLLFHYRDINTIALSEGLSRIRHIFQAYRTMKRELTSGVHNLFIPVDYPDVNLRLCRFARNAGVAVCYYISPQVWAWRKGRIRTIAARVDRMMTIFPFEEALYRDAGVRADFVGHTMVRDLALPLEREVAKKALGIGPQATAIAILPGSRPAEIQRMLPVMCEAARMHRSNHPDAVFLLPVAGDHLLPMIRDILASFGVPVTLISSDAAGVMAACDYGLVTSGTATLQAALVGMPHAVAYKLDPLTWLFALKILKPLVMDKDIHVAIANVLSISREKDSDGPIQIMLDAGYRIPCQECGRPLFVPELLQDQASARNMAAWLEKFSSDIRLRQTMERGFSVVRRMLSPPDDGRTPARIVLDCLSAVENQRAREP
ncbi:MAG: lipid-A-disaccharide synthase [Thermodesulfobacteriota bacterium]